MNNQIIEATKAASNILSQIYTDLAQPSVQAIGKSLGTVFEYGASMLLPLKLHNEKCKLALKRGLDEYQKKLEGLPEEKRCEVHPQLGIPVLDKLTYITNDEIADMFTTLLANASNIDMFNTAHPSFVGMIERMSTDEARLLKYLKDKDDIQYCIFNGNIKDGKGYRTLFDHVTLLEDEVRFSFPQNISAYLVNFVSLGILKDMSPTYKVDKTIYTRIRENMNLKQLEEKLVPNVFKSISVVESFYEVTDFGKLFIRACIQ